MDKNTIVDYFRNPTSDIENDKKFHKEMSTVVAEMMSKHGSAKTIIRENPCAEISTFMVRNDNPKFITVDSLSKIAIDKNSDIYRDEVLQKADELNSILGKNFTKAVAIHSNYVDEHESELINAFKLQQSDMISTIATGPIGFSGIRGTTSKWGSTLMSSDTEAVVETPSLDKVRLWAFEYGYSLTKLEFESIELTGTNKIKLKEE